MTKESENLIEIGASEWLIDAAQKREAAEAKPDEFVVYRQGLCFASVCSSLPEHEAIARMEGIPSGTSHGWSLADEPVNGHTSNIIPCDTKPQSHKHFLFSC